MLVVHAGAELGQQNQVEDERSCKETVFAHGFSVDSEHASNDGEYITSEYEYESTSVSTEGGRFVATPTSSKYTFKTEAKVP
eukprot:COSAG02_NODE_7780_length_2849_cov_1.052364_3_plen_81_part_01